MFVCVGLLVCLSVCVPACVPAWLPVWLPVCSYVYYCQSTCPPFYLSALLPVRPFTCTDMSVDTSSGLPSLFIYIQEALTCLSSNVTTVYLHLQRKGSSVERWSKIAINLDGVISKHSRVVKSAILDTSCFLSCLSNHTRLLIKRENLVPSVGKKSDIASLTLSVAICPVKRE